MNHIKFASDLGFLIARAKFASDHPNIEEKQGFWKNLPQEQKDLLLNLDKDSDLDFLNLETKIE